MEGPQKDLVGGEESPLWIGLQHGTGYNHSLIERILKDTVS